MASAAVLYYVKRCLMDLLFTLLFGGSTEALCIEQATKKQPGSPKKCLANRAKRKLPLQVLQVCKSLILACTCGEPYSRKGLLLTIANSLQLQSGAQL